MSLSPGTPHGEEDLNGLDKNVKLFLDGLRLEQYYDNFRKHDIDFELFFTLTNEDLKNIGIDNEDDRRTLLRAATKKPSDSDEVGRSLTKEEADAILSNSYKYLNVLKLFLKEVDPTKAKHKIKNTTLDFENSAAAGIITFSDAAIKCVDDLQKQYIALVPNDVPKKPLKTKSFWNVPVLTVLVTGLVISGFIVRKLNKPS